MKFRIKGKEIVIGKDFFLNDSMGMLITALGATIVFGPIAGFVVAGWLIVRMIKNGFKKK